MQRPDGIFHCRAQNFPVSEDALNHKTGFNFSTVIPKIRVFLWFKKRHAFQALPNKVWYFRKYEGSLASL